MFLENLVLKCRLVYWKLNVYQLYLLIIILYVVFVDFVIDVVVENGVCVFVRIFYDIVDDYSVVIIGGVSLLCIYFFKCYCQSNDFDDILLEFVCFWELFILRFVFCFVWYLLYGFM